MGLEVEERWDPQSWLIPGQLHADLDLGSSKTAMEWLEPDNEPISGFEADPSECVGAAPEEGVADATDMEQMSGLPSAPARADDSSSSENDNRPDHFLEEDFETKWPKLPSKAKKKWRIARQPMSPSEAKLIGKGGRMGNLADLAFNARNGLTRRFAACFPREHGFGTMD